MVIRVAANAVMIAGFLLLANILYGAINGSLPARVFTGLHQSWIYNVYALGLILPVPFHIISIGLVLKRKWLSPFWGRAAWPAIVLSGCWLAAAIGVKYMVA
ncbi:MAG: hypothetical protein JRG79_05970 [Deltaproteobacteria bacterium]|nr:hypothetical protein [Deltaproteobacteria bacterium]MBW1942273.1 hypothetical protein [Deltaproteobacteria bacterium]MBW2206439.1 hypothetical protein [Deltaproteobacteria bacterium]